MPSPELSKNESFYQLACQTTDTFASCIRIYEALLPYFETERPCHGVNKRLLNIGEMLTTLYNELTTLKNEITTDVVVGGDDKVTKPSVESIDLAQVVSDCSPQENIICGGNSVIHKAHHKEEVRNKLPQSNWEDVRQLPGDEYESEKVNHEDNKREQTLSHDVNLQLKSNENLKKQASNFGYMCENSNKAITGGDDKVTKPSVENIHLAQVVSDYSHQENIICEANSVKHEVLHKEEVLNKLPQRHWEDVRQLPGDEYKREEVNYEDNKREQTLSHDVNLQLKSNENLKNQASDFGYMCENCNKAITVYNQDLDLSITLHNQDGCCRGRPSKVIAVQKERQERKVDMVSAQEQNVTKYQKASNRSNVTRACLDRAYKVGDTRFGCIKSLGNGFLCTVCNKMLAGPKNFVEHVRGNYHQTLLNESTKEIQKNTVFETNITYAQLVKSTYVEQRESILSLNAQLSKIIKCLSGSLYSERRYLSVREGVIMCNLCDCKVPPTVTNVRDHVLGSRHSKNKADVQLPNNTLHIKV